MTTFLSFVNNSNCKVFYTGFSYRIIYKAVITQLKVCTNNDLPHAFFQGLFIRFGYESIVSQLLW